MDRYRIRFFLIIEIIISGLLTPFMINLHFLERMSGNSILIIAAIIFLMILHYVRYRHEEDIVIDEWYAAAITSGLCCAVMGNALALHGISIFTYPIIAGIEIVYIISVVRLHFGAIYVILSIFSFCFSSILSFFFMIFKDGMSILETAPALQWLAVVPALFLIFMGVYRLINELRG